MSASYDKFVKRLIAYRKANGLSQEEMGRRSNLTQSHYNKIENMSKIMSYNSLAVLNRTWISADFLVTGIEQKHTVLNDLLKQCHEADRADFMYMTVMCMELGLKYKGAEHEKYQQISRNEIKLLRYDMEDNGAENHSVWKSIRRINSLTQEKISRELDIDIKTYRDIEKGKSKPNVEILSLIYDKFGYPPSLILDAENKNYLFIINEIWIRLSEELQNKIENELKRLMEFIHSIRS